MASPATKEDSTTAPIRASQRGPRLRPFSAAKTATSAAVAAKDIWNPGPASFLGPTQQHENRRDRHGPQGKRAPPREDGGQHDGDHDEGPFRCHAAAGEQQIARAADESHRRRQAPRVEAQRHPGPERQPVADRPEDESHQQPHVQPRNREEMRQVRVPQRLQRLGRNR